jgi:hypothetical protein
MVPFSFLGHHYFSSFIELVNERAVLNGSKFLGQFLKVHKPLRHDFSENIDFPYAFQRILS